MSSDSTIRASDADRERVIGILGDAYAAGRLTKAELEERTTAAFAGRTWGELRSLTGDLPAGQDRAVGPPPGADREDGPPREIAAAHGDRRAMPLLPVALIWLAVAASAHAPEAFIPIMVFLLVAFRISGRTREDGVPGRRCGCARDPSGRDRQG